MVDRILTQATGTTRSAVETVDQFEFPGCAARQSHDAILIDPGTGSVAVPGALGAATRASPATATTPHIPTAAPHLPHHNRPFLVT